MASQHIIVGLGNPGDQYHETRHNIGRMLVLHIAAAAGVSEWKGEKKPPLQVARGSLAGRKAVFVLPDTFMNNSGRAVAHFVKSKKDAGNTVVAYDDMDLPLGTIKISHGRSSGGHNGVESVIRSLRTKDFVRVRIGISPKGVRGQARKPKGEERVLKFLLSKCTPAEKTELQKVFKRALLAVEAIVEHGYQSAMTEYN